MVDRGKGDGEDGGGERERATKLPNGVYHTG